MSLVQSNQLLASPQRLDSSVVYEALLETIGDAVIFTDLDGRIRYWNPGATRVFGYAADEVLGRTPAILYPDESPERLRADLERILAGQDFVGEWQGRRRDGSRVWIEVRTTVVRDHSGSPLGFLGVSKDINDRKAAEGAMVRQGVLEAVARLAGGVAHESNNQMAVVLGVAAFLLRRNDVTDGVRQDLIRIRTAAEHTATITRQLLAFSRQQLLHPSILDLNATILATASKVRRLLGEQRELQLDLAPELPLVRIDEAQLQHVLLSLADNASNAMREGGRLSLRTREALLPDGSTRSSGVHLPPGRYVELLVLDTGAGMDSETMTHLFQPFFTTKDVGQGTGLGLASVYGIVKQSGGYVFAESSPGHGTAFRILLPAQERP